MENIHNLFDEVSDTLREALNLEYNSDKLKAFECYEKCIKMAEKALETAAPIQTRKNIQENLNIAKKRSGILLRNVNLNLDISKSIVPDNAPTLNNQKMKGDPKYVKIIMDELITKSSVRFSDIAGQDTAKQRLKEMIIWPYLNPQVICLSI